jgi:hypothetical protein
MRTIEESTKAAATVFRPAIIQCGFPGRGEPVSVRFVTSWSSGWLISAGTICRGLQPCLQRIRSRLAFARAAHPDERLSENKKLEQAKAQYGAAAGRKDLGGKLGHFEIACELECSETDTKGDSAGQEIAKKLPAPISFPDCERNSSIQPKSNKDRHCVRNDERSGRRNESGEKNKHRPIKQRNAAADAEESHCLL